MIKIVETNTVRDAWDPDLLRVTGLDGGKIVSTTITVIGSLTYNALQQLYKRLRAKAIWSAEDSNRKRRLEKRWLDSLTNK